MFAHALEELTGLVTQRRSRRSARTFDLGADATVRLVPPRDGLVLTASGGPLVVTQAEDREDHILEAGQALRLRGRGVVVAWALAPARLTVTAR